MGGGKPLSEYRRAVRLVPGRVVSVLEGGYDLNALANSCLAHLDALREP